MRPQVSGRPGSTFGNQAI